MSKTANAGLLTGVVFQLAGATSSVAILPVLALPVAYNVMCKQHKGGKKVAMVISAGIMSLFTVAGGMGITAAVTNTKLKSSTPVAVSTPATTPAEPVVPVEPTLSVAEAWNSANNKKALEYSIKNNSANQLTGAEQSIATVSCKATSVKPIWHCAERKLGDTETVTYRIEVDYPGQTWAGTPL